MKLRKLEDEIQVVEDIRDPEVPPRSTITFQSRKENEFAEEFQHTGSLQIAATAIWASARVRSLTGSRWGRS